MYVLSLVGLIHSPPSHLFVLTQKKNHVPKHCERHRANDRWKGSHLLRLQQPHQEGNRHVCNWFKQTVIQLRRKLCPVCFIMFICEKISTTVYSCKPSAEVAGCHLLSPDCLSLTSRAMMMTGCDLSAITKPWEVQSKVGGLHSLQSLPMGLWHNIYWSSQQAQQIYTER